ncbi:hypothetical protein C0991_012278 [Blastosporella zonata]|nr:hypothetical protein C0991_012278 [Blastosporella zonata]
MTLSEYSAAIRSAVQLGKKTLNRYYSKTDYSNIYHFVMVLDPCYKLLYFQTMEWKESWITEGRELVEKAFETYSDPDFEHVKDDKDNEGVLMINNPQFCFTDDKKFSNMFKDFLEMAATALSTSAQAQDELKLYLNMPPESLKFVEKNKEKNILPLQ